MTTLGLSHSNRLLDDSLDFQSVNRTFRLETMVVQYHHQHNVYISSICTGAFVLAESGILDRKRATTHWLFANKFRKRYPQVKLREQHIITEDSKKFYSV